MSIMLKAADFIPENKSYASSVSAESRKEFMHEHDFYEIAYLIDSYGIHRSQGRDMSVSEGFFIIAAPGISHATISAKEPGIPRIRTCNCLFKREFFEKLARRFLTESQQSQQPYFELLQSQKPYCIVMPDNPEHTVADAVKAIRRECDRGESCLDRVVENYLENILVEASRIYNPDISRSRMGGSRDERLDELINYMKSNMDLPLTLAGLAEYMHFSPEYLSRYFKKKTGKTIMQSLAMMRMERAQELLLLTTNSVSEIGYMCGYSSVSNFRKYFTKLCGVSPSEYRKAYFSPS